MSTTAGPRAESSKSSRPRAVAVTAYCSTCASPWRPRRRQFAGVAGKRVAHRMRPRAIDEPEKGGRVLGQSLAEFGRSLGRPIPFACEPRLLVGAPPSTLDGRRHTPAA